MRRRKGGRTFAAAAASAAAHIAVLAVLALQAPMLRTADQDSGPPLSVIPVLLTPKTPPATSGRPSPIRLHRRPQRFAPNPPPIAPLPIPPEPARPALHGETVHPAPLPQSPKMELRATLRVSPVGCANPDAVGLTPAEREACYAQLGKGARTTPFPGLGLSAAKQAEFDRAEAHKEACRAYRDSPGGQPPPLREGPC
jgi:hypothetical protein